MSIKLKISSIIFCVFISLNTFSQKENWMTGFPDAFELSIKENKPIMANFTGSDWCGWCMKLDRAVFLTEEFKKWAENNVILLELDFPRRKKLDKELEESNNQLQSIFRVRGFPSIWVFSVTKTDDEKFSINAQVDPNGQGWQKMGFMSSSSAFISKAEGIIKQMSVVFED